MLQLVDAILRLGSSELATEDAACDALARLRFPDGISCPRCRHSCTRERATVTCPRQHRFTLLVDTPFASKRRPRIRALFLAIRAFALSPRSVSAAEIAREVGAPANTIWRHLHTLRALLPPPAARPTALAATVQVTGKRSAAEKSLVRIGATAALHAELIDRSRDVAFANDAMMNDRDVERIEARNRGAERLIGETLRATLVGTFRGVSSQWLRAYVNEAQARWRVRSLVAHLLVERLLGVALPLTFRTVAMQSRPW